LPAGLLAGFGHHHPHLGLAASGGRIVPIVSGSGRTAADIAQIMFAIHQRAAGARRPIKGDSVLAKVFPIKLKDGMQARAEAIVQEFAPKGPGVEDGTLSFRVYRDPAKVDYLLFVEHFADQSAYDAHTSSPAYQDLIAGQFADVIVEFVEIDHDLVVAL
jgi:quinol monooxygenase YgiN